MGLPSHPHPIQAALCGGDRSFVLKDLGQRTPSLGPQTPAVSPEKSKHGRTLVSSLWVMLPDPILAPPCVVFRFGYCDQPHSLYLHSLLTGVSVASEGGRGDGY